MPAKKTKLGSCKVCNHPDRVQLDANLYEGSIDQTTAANLVGCSRRTVFNHVKEHLAQALVEAGKGNREQLIDALNLVELKTQRVMDESFKAKNHELTLKAAARREAQIKLSAELTGALQKPAENEAQMEQRARQLEFAIADIITKAKAQGLTITPGEAIDGLGKIRPDIYQYLGATKYANLQGTIN